MSRLQANLAIEYALLGYLRPGPIHGYAIYQQLANPAGLGLVWQLKQGQLYALLERLEEEGFIEASLEPQEARPPRKLFTLTEKGEQEFLEWVERAVIHGRQLRLEFLAKLFFARRESSEVANRLINRQRADCLAWLTAVQQKVEASSEQPYTQLVHAFRAGQIQAMLDWLTVCQQSINQ